jgi:hypothetical protein
MPPRMASDNGAPQQYLVFVWRPTGYRLEERDGAPPEPGAEVEVGDGATQRVGKIGPSPLPGDRRPCAYLQP